GTADTLTYAWSVTKSGAAFASGTTANFTFTPVDDATYQVTLVVTDDDNGSDSATKTITSQAAPVITSGPTADINPAVVRQVVNFSCAATDADAITWAWDFGDG